MNKPAIIDQEIEFTVFSHSVLIPPHEVEDYDANDPSEVTYAKAMDLISEGKALEGKLYLDEAYKMGNWRAGNALAHGLSVGWFGERDNEAHLVILRDLVKQGSRDAMNNLAFAYDHGFGLRKSLRWAIYWYEKAAERGGLDAMSNLADLYLFRESKYSNVDRGVLMAFKGADLGSETAMNALGLCYENGYGVPLSNRKAFEWMTKAVENGAGAPSEHDLARFYRKGIGTEVDKAKAEEWDQIAAEHGYKIDPKTKNYDPR